MSSNENNLAMEDMAQSRQDGNTRSSRPNSLQMPVAATNETELAHPRPDRTGAPPSRGSPRNGTVDKDMDEEGRLNQELTYTKKGKKKTPKMPYDTIRASRGSMLRVLSGGEESNQESDNRAIIRNVHEMDSKEKWESLNRVSSLIIEDEEQMLSDVPKQLWQLQNLQSLTLRFCKISSLSKPSIAGLKKLSALVKLKIADSNLKSVNCITQLHNLEELDLSRNQVSSLTEDIGRLGKLKVLNVSGNKLKTLPNKIGCLIKLIEFDCSSNKFETLPEAFGCLESLQVLDVSLNKLKVLPIGLLQMMSLKQLRAGSNRISSLPGDMSNLAQLQYIFLSKNMFKEVPIGLGTLPNLLLLNMSKNEITEMSCCLPSVQTLLLDQNALEAFPLSILQCSKLTVLSLENNRLRNIPTEIAKLRSLRALNVGGNDIKEVPENIVQLDDLRRLSLKSTRISSLPENIDRLRRLSVLDIEETELSADVKYAYHQDGMEGLKRQLSISRDVQEDDNEVFEDKRHS